jgi:pyruvate dehydrogenase E2 component (dihydrolipoamide acetyltransferase)
VPVGVTLATLRTGEEAVASTGAVQPEPALEPAAAVEPKREPPAAEDWRTGMRRAIAAAMSKSKREIPHYYLATDIEMTRTLAWLAEQNAKRSVAQRLLPVVPIMKGVALALREVPGLNGTWSDGEFKSGPAVHLGMAVSMRGGGLIAPAIHDADTKSIDELMSALRDLIERVRGGRLRSSEMTDATVTLTNLGDMGVERVYGVIYPPQVALIGCGKIGLRPWVSDGALVARQIVTATLAADHRASDGLVGARFLSALDRILQEPQRLESAS